MSAGTAPSPLLVTEEERLARATIALIAEPGDVHFMALTRELGGIGVLRALREHPDRHDLLTAAAARLQTVNAARVLEQAEGLGIRFVVPGDAEWPCQLDDLAAAGALQERGGVPAGLWVRGRLRLDELGGSVAVVGSRSSTSYGETLAGEIAANLGYAGVPVVSGGAFGIDYAAHRGAVVAGAPTVAVLACGADRVYPAAHRPMLEHLGREHALVSEAPLGAAPQRVRFLARNRLIAALTRGTVVVEAAARSGALNTLNWAARLNRITMGVPGPVTSATSEGIHHHLRIGTAALVTSGRDVLELIGRPGENLTEEPRGPETVRDRLSVQDRQVLDAVPVVEPVALESLAVVAGLGVLELRKSLRRLEERDLVEHVAGGWRLTERARR
jgi:DNA processing protein